MRLLDFPQELLDLIATHLDAFSYGTLKCTSKHVYYTFGGDKGLRRALGDLESHWSRESHVMAVLLKEPHVQPQQLPSYSRFLRRAPCYTCLRVSTPSDTLFHSHHGKYRDIAMLPWDGFGGFDANQLNNLDLQRECIDCTIRHAQKTRDRQVLHLNMANEFVLFCSGCQEKTFMSQRPVSRQVQAGLCDKCFTAANPGWQSFKSRLDVRMRRLTRYQSWLRVVMKCELRSASEQVTSQWLSTGPLPPSTEVREDWSLWSTVFNDDAYVALTYAELSKKFAAAIAHMRSYLSWMQLVDDCRSTYQHGTTPPVSDQFADLGEWPTWPTVVQQMRSVAGKGAKPIAANPVADN